MSFSEQFNELQTSEFDITYKGKTIHFRMKETLGLDDERWITQFTNMETGKVDMGSLWAKRLSTSLIEPRLASADINALPKGVLSTLMTKWALLNSIDQSAFLESAKAKKKDEKAEHSE